MLNFTKTGRSLLFLSGAAFIVSASALWPQRPASADDMKMVPPPSVDAPSTGKTATAVFAGGCFWGVQGVYQHVKGVTSAVSGYSGGPKANASYQAVSNGDTGHAEAVKITYDPTQVSYGKLLQIYFSVVTDPTQLNRQGPDDGTQYRSDIFAMNAEQAKVASDYVEQLKKAHVYGAPVVTKVSTFKAFYPAEAYHQNYLTLHPDNGYIAANDIPKVEGLKKIFPRDYSPDPVLAATN